MKYGIFSMFSSKLPVTSKVEMTTSETYTQLMFF